MRSPEKKRSALRNFLHFPGNLSVLQEKVCLHNFFYKLSGVLHDETRNKKKVHDLGPFPTSQKIDKFDVLRGRLLGNHDDFHCKGSAIFSLVYFKYHKWKIIYSLQSLCRCASAKGLSSSAKSLVQLGNNFVRKAEGCRWELKARNSAVQLCAS